MNLFEETFSTKQDLIVLSELQDAFEINVDLIKNGVIPADDELLKALDRVIQYYSLPEDYEQWEKRKSELDLHSKYFWDKDRNK